MYHEVYNIIHQEYDYDLDFEILRDFCIAENLSLNQILEVGCGTGGHTAVLSKYFKQVIAVDLDPEMINQARNRLSTCENVSLFVKSASDLKELGLLPKDIICSFFNVINYLIDFDQLRAFFLSIVSSMSSGGGFVCDSLDSSIEYSRESSSNYSYEVAGKVLNRKVKSIYDFNHETLDVHETYTGNYLESPSEFKKKYKIWTADEVAKVAVESGLRFVSHDKKFHYKPAFGKRNQTLYFFKKD